MNIHTDYWTGNSRKRIRYENVLVSVVYMLETMLRIRHIFTDHAYESSNSMLSVRLVRPERKERVLMHKYSLSFPSIIRKCAKVESTSQPLSARTPSPPPLIHIIFSGDANGNSVDMCVRIGEFGRKVSARVKERPEQDAC